MTRHSFGGTTADFVQQVDNTGIVHAGNGITCSFFTAQSGGTAVIDLQDMNGNPITTVSADANGGIPQFMGPDDGSSALWVSGGGANRQLMAATDIPSRVNTLEISGGGGGTAGVTSINGKTGVIAVLAPADVGLGNVNNTSDAAKPLSTASTNALAAKADLVGGLIPSSQLPAVSLVKPTPVATQAAMLALTATDVQPGDVAVVANDPGRGSYMLNAADPSVLGNWLLLTSPTDAVTSVNGHTGVVVLAAADVSAWSLNPVQRGVWAPTTAYALGDIAISPTGDIITPKVAFTSGAAYLVANWNILVPAQNYGRELTGAESSADLNLLSTAGSWTDVPGVTGNIPAGIPFTCEINALGAAVQGTAAANSITGIQLRVVDTATATNIYGFAWRQFVFSAASGMTLWQSMSGLRRGVALGASTPVKMQAQGGALAGQGNIGLFPASGGGGEPTTFVVRGR